MKAVPQIDPVHRWDLKILKFEMTELQREQRHLARKSKERSLTPWEIERTHDLLDEVMNLLKKFGDIRRQNPLNRMN